MFPYVVGSVALGTAKGALETYATWNRERVSNYTGAKISELTTVQMRIAEASASIEAAERMFMHRGEEAQALTESGTKMTLEN